LRGNLGPWLAEAKTEFRWAWCCATIKPMASPSQRCIAMAVALCAAGGWLLCGAGWPARAAEAQQGLADESEAFFNHGPIPSLHIEIGGTNLAMLRRNHRTYVRATVREGDKVYADVGIHLKGAAGSFRGLDDKPALTLNFDKFRPGQAFHGLDKIHLNNSVQDSSFLCEILCGELFRAAGVPAARGTHARVWLNGRHLGLYVLKEGFDKTFLRRYFRNPNGNLYDGGFLKEITEPIERTSGEGDVPPHSELKALAQAAREPDPAKRWQRLHQVLDVDRFISFIALEVMTWHWDGYAMKRNNYRVYHDPDSGKIVFFPHGMDQMFWEPRGSLLPGFEGLVAAAVVATPEGKRRYQQRLAELTVQLFQEEQLTNRIRQLQARVRPVLEAIGPEAVRQHEAAVNHLCHQVVQRARFLQGEVARPEPQPVQFGPDGVALLTHWVPVKLKDQSGQTSLARLDISLSPDGHKALHIATGPDGRCVDAWRTRLILPAGRYRFEARARTAGVVKLTESLKPGQVLKGEGAGIRLSRARQTRPNGLWGDCSWQQLQYEFEVTEPQSTVELVCELRAAAGQAWFDLESLRLRKL
jgi:spore coat protein H